MKPIHPDPNNLLTLAVQQQKAVNDQAHTYDTLKVQTQASRTMLNELLSIFLATKRKLAELGLEPPDLLDHTAELAAQNMEPKALGSFKFPHGSTFGAN